jgi:DNA-binding CsgD family transcriptional regulator
MQRLTNNELRALLECIKECYSIHDVETLRRRLSSRLPKLVERKARRFHEVGPPPLKKVLDRSNSPFIYDHSSQDLAPKQPRSVLRTASQPTRNSSTNRFPSDKQIGSKPPGFRRLKIQHNGQTSARVRNKIGLLEGALDALHIGLIVQSVDGNVQLVTRCAIRQLRDFLGHCALQRYNLPATVFTWVKQQQLASARKANVTSPLIPLVLQQREKSLVIRCFTDSHQMSLVLEEKEAALQPVGVSGLSRRETQVLEWVSRGKTNKEIGAILDVSPRTVQKHLEHVYRKLNVTTRTAAAANLHKSA